MGTDSYKGDGSFSKYLKILPKVHATLFVIFFFFKRYSHDWLPSGSLNDGNYKSRFSLIDLMESLVNLIEISYTKSKLDKICFSKCTLSLLLCLYICCSFLLWASCCLREMVSLPTILPHWLIKWIGSKAAPKLWSLCILTKVWCTTTRKSEGS